jgi:hypothetical protein
LSLLSGVIPSVWSHRLQPDNFDLALGHQIAQSTDAVLPVHVLTLQATAPTESCSVVTLVEAWRHAKRSTVVRLSHRF